MKTANGNPPAEGKSTGRPHYALMPAVGQERDAFAGIVGTSAHRLSKGKAPLIPVFVDNGQRRWFHDRAVKVKRYLKARLAKAARSGDLSPEEMRDTRNELEATRALARASRRTRSGNRRGPSARFSFDEAQGRPVRAHMFMHTSLGTDYAENCVGGMRTYPSGIAETLKRLRLPPDSEIVLTACSGAQGKPLQPQRVRTSDGAVVDIRDDFLHGQLGSLVEPESSFGAKFQKALDSAGLRATTSAFVGVAFSNARTTLQQDGWYRRHMATELPGELSVRRRDVRITFGPGGRVIRQPGRTGP